jgi:hypothetical protein
MLRNLCLAGLTALLLASLAPAARAARGGTAATATATAGRKPEPIHKQAPETDLERPVRPAAPVKKKATTPTRRARAAKTAARRRIRRLHAAVVNNSLIRQSWSVADLNPMPALLDLDDTAQNLRRATAEIVRLMRR